MADDFPSYFPDWFVTLSSIAGTPLPEQQTLDGIDLLPELMGRVGLPTADL